MKLYFFAALLCVAAGLPVQAALIFGNSSTGFPSGTLNITTTTGVFESKAFNSGWFLLDGFHEANNKNYAAADSSLPCTVVCLDSADTHNFFTFRLGSGVITGTILSATFSAPNALDGYQGTASGLTFSLWDVITKVDTLDADFAAGLEGIAVYDDLGGGTLYGTRLVNESDNGTNVVVNLNAAALAALETAAAGPSLFAMGGSISAVKEEVPEPATWGLIAAGLTCVALRHRRNS